LVTCPQGKPKGMKTKGTQHEGPLNGGGVQRTPFGGKGWGAKTGAREQYLNKRDKECKSKGRGTEGEVKQETSKEERGDFEMGNARGIKIKTVLRHHQWNWGNGGKQKKVTVGEKKKCGEKVYPKGGKPDGASSIRKQTGQVLGKREKGTSSKGLQTISTSKQKV